MTIESMKTTIQTVAIVAGSLSLVVATVAYLLSRKGLQFNVMLACINRFQELLPLLNSDDVTKREVVLRYLDLCNEELFYFQEKYLRKEVALDWIDGMLNFLPLLNQATGSPWEGQSFLPASDRLIQQFPRVEHAFSSSPVAGYATMRRHARRVDPSRVLGR